MRLIDYMYGHRGPGFLQCCFDTRESVAFQVVIQHENPFRGGTYRRLYQHGACTRSNRVTVMIAMNLKSQLFDRVRVKPLSRDTRPPDRTVCQFPGCSRAGDFRAPMGRLYEGHYFCFCLEHVREYNLSYNYFSGMSLEAIERFRRDDLVGHRPTWTMGAFREARTFFAQQCTPCHSDRGPRIRSYCGEKAQARYGVAALRALELLGLDDSVDMAVIRTRYKELVKRLHPDSNSGDRSNEDRLREIIRAYNYLKSIKPG